MSPDLLAAIVSLVNHVMGTQLRATPGTPKAWPEYAPHIHYPYAVVSTPSETYEYQSSGPDNVTTMIADGQMTISFYSTSMTEARSLGRSAAVLLPSYDVDFLDGRLLEFRPVSSTTTPLFEEGVLTPTVFVRAVMFHYREQFSQEPR